MSEMNCDQPVWLIMLKNALTGETIFVYAGHSIWELSQSIPISINGTDYALMHSDIENPSDWYVIFLYRDPKTGKWREVEDPRIYDEDGREELYYEYIL